MEFNREQGVNNIISAGFDIETEAAQLVNLYKKSLGK